MMRLAMLSLSTLALAAPALAQNPFGRMEIGVNPAVLMNPVVQKDMKMTPAQVQKTTNTLMRLGQKMMPLTQKMRTDPSAPQKIRALYQQLERDIMAPLTPPQRVRLRQITLQSIGAAGALQPSVAKKIGLPDAQRAKIQARIGQSNAKWLARMRAAARPGGRTDVMAMLKLQEEMKNSANATVLGMLTPAQKAKWNAMLGKPIKLGGMMGMGGAFGG